jgi:hypothetical protein
MAARKDWQGTGGALAVAALINPVSDDMAIVGGAPVRPARTVAS